MIIVEGPDGGGKTTLIQQLRELTRLEVAPRVVTKDAEALVDLVGWVDDNIAEGFQKLIFDRHRLISEPIYGPILRKDFQPRFDEPQWFYPRLRTLYDLKPVIIYCLPPYETVRDNVMEDSDNSIFHQDPDLIKQVWGAYFNKALTEHALCPDTWVYDYTDGSLADILVKVMADSINKRLLES